MCFGRGGLTLKKFSISLLIDDTMKIRIRTLKCKRCGHEWVPRKRDVRICPRCKSAFWDEEKKKKKDTP